MTTYTADVHREGRWLVAHVIEIDHSTQGRTFDEVEYMVRDLVRLSTGHEHAGVQIMLRVEDPDVQEELEAALTARHEAAVATERAAVHSQRAAAGLKAAGFTVRDIGALLGVTFQRAHQIVTAARHTESA